MAGDGRRDFSLGIETMSDVAESSSIRGTMEIGHYGILWVCGYEGQAWDDITTDT